MRNKSFERDVAYRNLMKLQGPQRRVLGVISCKILRDRNDPYKEQWHKVEDFLAGSAFRELVKKRDWHLALTGGTFDTLFPQLKNYPEYRNRLHRLAASALGVIQIANLAVYGHLLGVAFFNHMEDHYADSPQNLCLRRICNYCETPLLEDLSSIEYVFRHWPAPGPAPVRLGFDVQDVDRYYGLGSCEDRVLSGASLGSNRRRNRSQETLAIVAHNDKKMEMLNFCLEHMEDILSYRRVISTGTTGKYLRDQLEVALRALGSGISDGVAGKWGWDRAANDTPEDFLARKIQPLASGPKGGDVQISAKVIDGTCHRVLFFQDPESAHPHQFDIRLMEKAVQDPETAALFATSKTTARIIV